jgi:hypothetical protein
MVSLAITATLLTAAAAAFNASSQVVQENDEFFRATQAARISLHQILTQVRRGTVQLASDPHWVRLTTAPAEGEVAGDDVTYRYLPANQRLVLVTNADATDPDYTLASNVSGVTFDVDPGTNAIGAACVARVSVTIKVRVGSNEVTLTGAAAPRRNLQY